MLLSGTISLGTAFQMDTSHYFAILLLTLLQTPSQSHFLFLPSSFIVLLLVLLTGVVPAWGDVKLGLALCLVFKGSVHVNRKKTGTELN